MMPKNVVIDHWCKVCGKGYHACDECERKDASQAIKWRSVACSMEHYQAYLVMHEFDSGLLTKEEARGMLDNCLEEDEWITFTEPCLTIAGKIYAEEEQP